MDGEAAESLFVGCGLDCARGGRAVFAGLDFALGPGAALVLRGPNGSGKSSLLRILAGLLRPTGGTLEWQGGPIREEPELHCARLHYVGHPDALKAVLTVTENVAFWTGLRGPTTGVGSALDWLRLSDLADVPARYLSAGQRRRANIARLLASPAALWLLDEPTVTLDDASVDALVVAIEDHRAGGGLVVVATHGVLALEGAQTLEMADFTAPEPEVP